MAVFPPHVTKALMQLGLTQKQITIIHHLHSLSRVKVHTISQRLTKIGRTELYKILGELVKLHLVRKSKINNITYYELRKDEDIIRWANKMRHKLIKKTEAIDASIELLKTFLKDKKRTLVTKPVIHFFEGEKGLLLAHKHMFEREDEINAYINLPRIISTFSNYLGILGDASDDSSPIIKAFIPPQTDEFYVMELAKIPRLLFRYKDFSTELLTLIGKESVINFAEVDGTIKGFYLCSKNHKCADLFRRAFEIEWKAEEHQAA